MKNTLTIILLFVMSSKCVAYSGEDDSSGNNGQSESFGKKINSYQNNNPKRKYLVQFNTIETWRIKNSLSNQSNIPSIINIMSASMYLKENVAIKVVPTFVMGRNGFGLRAGLSDLQSKNNYEGSVFSAMLGYAYVSNFGNVWELTGDYNYNYKIMKYLLLSIGLGLDAGYNSFLIMRKNGIDDNQINFGLKFEIVVGFSVSF